MAVQSGGGQPWRVLVVDDEENLNWSLVTSLRREHYAADGALSAEAALQRLAEQPYDCVISDVKMPGMDGFELLQWLRAHQPRTRVIMMTAFGSPTARQEALRGGVVAYLEKPFDLRLLKEELRKLASTAAPVGQPAAEGYDTLDVAQVLHLARRDIALRVEAGQVSGTLRFVRGEIVSAEAGALTGDDAFFALCVPRAARVEPEPWDGRGERNISQPLSRLIFQARAMRERRTPAPAARAADTARPADAVAPADALAEATTAHLPAVSAAGGSAPAPRAPGEPPVSGSAAAAEPPPPSAPGDQQEPVQAGEGLPALLQTLARGFSMPCAIALLRSDGTLLAQGRTEMTEFPAGAYAHLALAAQAARRAMLVADWGAFEEYHAVASGAMVVVRRLARGERTVWCAVAMPRDADPALAGQQLARAEADLLAALR